MCVRFYVSFGVRVHGDVRADLRTVCLSGNTQCNERDAGMETRLRQ